MTSISVCLSVSCDELGMHVNVAWCGLSSSL